MSRLATVRRGAAVTIATFLFPALTAACADRQPIEPQENDELRNVVRSYPGGCVPEATVTYEGGLKKTLITFTPVDTTCASNYFDVSSFGMDMADPVATDSPQGNMRWDRASGANLQNLPSPGHAANGLNSVYQAFVEFDPPVRSVSFHFSSPVENAHWGGMGGPLQIGVDSMPVYAVSRTPGTIQYTIWDWEKLHANVASWEQLDVWDSVTLNAPWDLIQWLWFDGPVYIDDLEIVRAVGPVEMSCGFASRGEQATCTVTDTTVEEVTRWQFRGVNAAGDTLSVVDDTSSSTSWSGRVVMDGLVTATVLIDSIPRTTSDSLHVVQRPWRWFFDDYDNYNEGLLLSSCITWQSVDIDSLPVTVGINAAFGPDPCEPGPMLLPSPFSSPLDGFTVDSVLSGPNAGFYFVGSADYGSVRGSLVHPQLDASAAQNPIQPCKKLTPSNLANWYQYNTTCKNFDADGFVQGAWDHEGYGSQGDNGHQSLFEAAAAEEGGDPEHRIESMVHEIQGELWIDVRNELLLTNQDLFNATNVHPMMPSNFCSGFIWIYRAADSTFVKRRMGNGPGEFQCP